MSTTLFTFARGASLASLAGALAVGVSGCAGSTRDGGERTRRAMPPPALAANDRAAARPRALEELEAAQAAWAAARADPADRGKRLLATSALDAFYERYRAQAELLGDLLVEAAHADATLRESAGDPAFRDWYRQTMLAFLRYQAATRQADGSQPTDGTRLADLGAEAAFALADERIVVEWEHPGRLAYDGDPDAARRTLDRDVAAREQLFVELESIRFRFRSHRFLPLLLAREATLYDAHRDALLGANVLAIAPAKAAQLSALEARCQQVIADPSSSAAAIQACQSTLATLPQLRLMLGRQWPLTLPQYLHDVEMRAAQRYRAATLRAAAIGVVHPLMAQADRRLAELAVALGNARMQTYVAPSPGTPEAAEWAAAFPADRFE